jgi:ATP-dependent RNA helicase RhlE
VVNFDVPAVPDDYIHRVGRTGRAELTGDAFTFVAQEEEGDLKAIERAIGKALPRVTLPDFDYRAKPQGKLEIPIAERIAAIRARKAEERARGKARGQRPSHPRTAAPPHSRTPESPSSRRFGPRPNARRRRP